MSLGWFTDLADAELYFTNERLVTTAWDDLTNAQKSKDLIMSYNRIFYSGIFTVPTYAAATPAQLVVLKKANGEMAYYLAVHLADEDKRKGIQAQGTIHAGIVEESYSEDWLAKLPIPPFVEAILSGGGFSSSVGFVIGDLGRNEDYSVHNQDSIYDNLK
jgi:hypothetical protein